MTLADLQRLTAHLPRNTVLVVGNRAIGYDALVRPREIRVRTEGAVWREANHGADVLAFDVVRGMVAP